MRLVGILLFAGGGFATAYAVRAVYSQRRPRDVFFAVSAPLAALIALLGLVLIFVPEFFGG